MLQTLVFLGSNAIGAKGSRTPDLSIAKDSSEREGKTHLCPDFPCILSNLEELSIGIRGIFRVSKIRILIRILQGFLDEIDFDTQFAYH